MQHIFCYTQGITNQLQILINIAPKTWSLTPYNMNDIALLVKKIRENGVGLSVSGKDLEVSLFSEEVDDNIIKEIKGHKKDIITYLNSLSSIKEEVKIPNIKKAPSYKVSSAQQRLWILSQMEESAAAYNLPMDFVLKGECNIDVIEKAIDAVIERHEILRTTFIVDEEGEVRQCITDPKKFNFKIQVEDFSKKKEIQKAISLFKEQDVVRLFDLEKGPLFRAALIQTKEDEYLFYFNMHHIISDGWSMDILARDFFAYYEAFKNETQPALPELTIQYKDYSTWQLSQMESDSFKKSKAYWLEKLAGNLPSLELSGINTRPKMMTYNGRSLKTHISKDISNKLRTFSQENGGSLFMTMFTAWNILFHRYTNQTDFVFGTPIAGRNISTLENQIGFYLNTLILRNEIDPKDNFLDCFLKVKDTILDAFANQNYPFDVLIQDLNVKRDLSKNAVFDVMFTLHSSGKLVNEINEKETFSDEITFTEDQFSKFDIDIELKELEDFISLTVSYNTDLYEDDIMKRLMLHFKQLLQVLIEQPNEAIASLNFLSAAEINELTKAFNNTKTKFPEKKTVLDLFEKQVKKSSDEVIFSFENKKFTYKELDKISNQIARCLQDKFKIQPEDLVAVKLPRNEWLFISILAILKSGAAYLPLDPEYPTERIEYIQSDSNCKICIDEDFISKFQKYEANYDNKKITSSVRPDNLAYIIYTSGSTGKPKGVMIEHRNLLNFIYGMDSILSLNSDNHLLALTSVSFDISILELLYTVCNGVKVTLKSQTTALSNFNEYLDLSDQQMDFSLLFFSSNGSKENDKYKLLFDSVKYADQNGFDAVWLPERHFHEFGGLFPNPAVLGASLASVTEQIQIRSGSVVLPIHDTIRVAEEWSVIDNISKGRVGLSIASGWNSNDFVFKPERYESRQAIMFDEIEELKKLWKGGAVKRINGVGEEVEVKIFPKPIQKEIPIWVTSGGNENTFRNAGKIGANILTHLLGQEIGELKKNITAYKEELRNHGHSVEDAKITLMLHTYIGEDLEKVKSIVRTPFKNYLKSSVRLIKGMLREFSDDIDNISESDMDSLLDLAFERYWQTSGLLGTKESCMKMVESLKVTGITEIACLVDFGIDHDVVMDGMDALNEVRKISAKTITNKSSNPTHPSIDSMQITPSYLKVLAEDPFSDSFLQSLKNLIVGGESFPQDLANLMTKNTTATITNMYGPTETTIWSTSQRIESNKKVTVGKPIQNTSIYILDQSKNLCPIGVEGELFIGGHGVARGYLNRPELTAKKFIQNPFEKDKTSIIYNTGDLARWNPDGTIELLGRADHQVKLNGHRIELGEIESVLLSYDGVLDAASIVQEHQSGSKNLCAYIVSKAIISMDDLRSFLENKLPRYMVPTKFIKIEKVPLTANGKKNYKALSTIEGKEFGKKKSIAKPSNDTEIKLVKIWSELLAIEEKSIGIYNNFFDLGGNSILVIKLLSRVKKTFNINITLGTIYGVPDISKLAQYIDGKTNNTQEVSDEEIDVLANTMEMAFNKISAQEN